MIAALSARARDFVTELRDPVDFVRSRPQVILIPAVFVLFVALWEWVVRQWSVPAFHRSGAERGRAVARRGNPKRRVPRAFLGHAR